MAQYFDSPFGPADFIHVNKPDTGIPGKFTREPTFVVDLRLSGKAALAFKEKVDAQCEAEHEAFKETDAFKKMKPKDQRELGIFRPYEEVEDDDGNPTGDIVFHFKQNAKIKLKDGSTKDIKIGIYDSEDNEMKELVGSGSVVRVRYSFRGIKAPSTPPAYGARLDFAAVQVKELKSGGRSGGGFGKVDDGYVSSGSTPADDEPASDDGSADY